MLAGELALTIAAVFTGAAIYINIAEQPARLQLDDRSLSSPSGSLPTSGLHDAGEPRDCRGLIGLVAYMSTLDSRWLLGAVVLLANWPYTIFVIVPPRLRGVAYSMQVRWCLGYAWPGICPRPSGGITSNLEVGPQVRTHSTHLAHLAKLSKILI